MSLSASHGDRKGRATAGTVHAELLETKSLRMVGVHSPRTRGVQPRRLLHLLANELTRKVVSSCCGGLAAVSERQFAQYDDLCIKTGFC